MKSRLSFLVLFFIFSLYIHAQNCIPTAIVFSTQAQVDAFPTDYPGCTMITGNIGITGNDITNVTGLSQITQIGGSLQILNTQNLTSLLGLDNLTSIGGSMIIKSTINLLNISFPNLTSAGNNIEISQNENFPSITVLNNLTELIGDLKIHGNLQLNVISGINSLTEIGGNIELTWNSSSMTLSGLNSLEIIGLSFIIITLPQNHLSLSGINNLNTVGNTISLTGNITNLSVFDQILQLNGSLNISNNSLSNLNHFNSLNHIGTILSINGNFSTISGFSALESVSSLKINGNQILTEITGFNNLQTVENAIYINDNNFLSSISGLDHDITFSNDARLLSLRSHLILSRQAAGIDHVLKGLSQALVDIEKDQDVVRLNALCLMDGFIGELERAFVHLGLSESQEASLSELARSTAARVGGILSEGKSVTDDLHRVGQSLRQLHSGD